MIVSIVSSDKIVCNFSELIAQTILTPGRYVGIADFEDDGEPFEGKMERVTEEFSGLFAEIWKAEKETRKQLKSVEFGDVMNT